MFYLDPGKMYSANSLNTLNTVIYYSLLPGCRVPKNAPFKGGMVNKEKAKKEK
jgi:hypothetical protein